MQDAVSIFNSDKYLYVIEYGNMILQIQKEKLHHANLYTVSKFFQYDATWKRLQYN